MRKIKNIFIFALSFKACVEQKYNFCLKKSYDLYKDDFMSKEYIEMYTRKIAKEFKP